MPKEGTSIEPRQGRAEVLRLLASAQHSVILRCNAHQPFIQSDPEPLLPLILRQADPRLKMRAILGILEYEGGYDPDLVQEALATSEIADAIRRKILRFNLHWDGWHGVIVDRREALLARRSLATIKEQVILLQGPSEVEPYVAMFDRQWEFSPEVSFVAPLGTDDLGAVPGVQVVSEEQWRHIIRSLAKDPAQIHALAPRRFEEFVATLLECEGMQVHLTPQTRDDGRDILAWTSTPVGRFLYLVECKRYAPDNPVGVGLVRQLYGVVEEERANGGIFITTSRFTPEAWSFGGKCGTRMALSDYSKLVEWLKKFSRF